MLRSVEVGRGGSSTEPAEEHVCEGFLLGTPSRKAREKSHFCLGGARVWCGLALADGLLLGQRKARTTYVPRPENPWSGPSPVPR